ncbi:MAG: hypothetical protein IJQ52_04885 [Bacteroidales bacterium]|nr:hypothetical protein [Bacteroidales bacterium]
MLEDLRTYFERLVALYEGQKAECSRLSAELESSKLEREALSEKIKGLEREIDNLKLTHAFSTPEGGNHAAREKIEKMIRQLDKCIAQLEQ